MQQSVPDRVPTCLCHLHTQRQVVYHNLPYITTGKPAGDSQEAHITYALHMLQHLTRQLMMAALRTAII